MILGTADNRFPGGRLHIVLNEEDRNLVRLGGLTAQNELLKKNPEKLLLELKSLQTEFPERFERIPAIIGNLAVDVPDVLRVQYIRNQILYFSRSCTGKRLRTFFRLFLHPSNKMRLFTITGFNSSITIFFNFLTGKTLNFQFSILH